VHRDRDCQTDHRSRSPASRDAPRSTVRSWRSARSGWTRTTRARSSCSSKAAGRNLAASSSVRRSAVSQILVLDTHSSFHLLPIASRPAAGHWALVRADRRLRARARWGGRPLDALPRQLLHRLPRVGRGRRAYTGRFAMNAMLPIVAHASFLNRPSRRRTSRARATPASTSPTLVSPSSAFARVTQQLTPPPLSSVCSHHHSSRRRPQVASLTIVSAPRNCHRQRLD
jgi:hypothetical protein